VVDKSKTNIITWKELFDDLRIYWLDKITKVSVATSEESLSDLSLPLNAQTRLCFFDIPQRLVSFYKSNVFPILVSFGYTPIIPTDLISPGDSILPTISSLIERASLVIIDIDISTTRQDYMHELELARKKEITVIVITEQSVQIPQR